MLNQFLVKSWLISTGTIFVRFKYQMKRKKNSCNAETKSEKEKHVFHTMGSRYVGRSKNGWDSCAKKRCCELFLVYLFIYFKYLYTKQSSINRVMCFTM